MIIKLDMSSDTPIYMQLRNQIILGIGSGEIKIGQKLPTVRALAAEIKINTMTVNKTYAILKKEGFILIDRRHGAKIADIKKNDALKSPNNLQINTNETKKDNKDSTADCFEGGIKSDDKKSKNIKDNLLQNEHIEKISKTHRVLSKLLSSERDEHTKKMQNNDHIDELVALTSAKLDTNSTEKLLLILTESILKGVKKGELLSVCKNLIDGVNILAE